MTTTWTVESALALAPDAASAAAGRGLATAAKWVSLGTDGAAVWGEAKGSGAKPYQVAIDLGEPAFKCSCPSRKFPCKHGLGLLLMFIQGACPNGNTPDFAKEWLKKREAKATKPKETAPPDPAAQAKRAERRQERVAAGLEEVGRWLRDTVRQGLASQAVQNRSHYESVAARMVDAQAPGIARRLREMAATVNSGEGWQERLANQLAMLHLIVEGYGRREELPEPICEELAIAVGFAPRKEELPTELRVHDRWSVVGQRLLQEERIAVQRSWLYGERTGRWAMVLAFSAANAPFDPLLVPGTAFEGPLAFYPGSQGLRALPVERTPAPFSPPLPTGLEEFADLLARAPWTEVGPITLTEASLTGPPWEVAGLTIVPSFQPWRWLAVTGGNPATVFGEWDGSRFYPLSIAFEGGFQMLEARSQTP